MNTGAVGWGPARKSLVGVVLTTLILASASGLAQTGGMPPSPDGQDPLLLTEELLTSEEDLLITEELPSVSIPTAPERPLGINEGPRVVVNEFLVAVAPELRRAAGERLMNEMYELVEQRRRQQPRDGFTIGEMESVAAAVTELFRERDFIVAYCYLPTQEVTGGVVDLNVLSGNLGQVNVEGNEILSTQRIALPFNHLLGKPLRKGQLEAAILTLHDYPGVAPSAVLSPGSAVASTDLTLRVSEERFYANFLVDNYGTRSTGEWRARALFGWNNPFRRGDQFDANILQTFDPTNGTYGGVSYTTPVGGQGLYLGASYNRNTFDVSRSVIDSGIGGDSEVAMFYLRKAMIRGRRLNFNFTGDLSIKEASIDGVATETQPNPEDKLTVLRFGGDIEGVDRIGPLGINSLAFHYHWGLPDFLGSMDEDGDGNSTRVGGTQGNRAGGDFQKGTLQYRRLQRLNASNQFVFRLFGQWTSDLLTSIEQMPLGGPFTVRAFPTAEFLADRGYFTSFDYIFTVTALRDPVPDNWEVNLSVFYDYAYGENIDPLPIVEFNTLRLGGAGIGLQVDYEFPNGHQLVGRLEVATPTTGHDAGDLPDGDTAQGANTRDPQYWLRLEYFLR